MYVDTGDGVERHVWCGAFNMQAGDVVPLAVIGTTMADGQTIERRGILGIDSEGMLCSARELGLGDDHAGILILPPDSPLGVPYGDVLGVEPDVLFDLDVTRNRPDCWGYVGVARDLAAHLGLELRVPAPELADDGEEHQAERRDPRRRPLRALHVDGHVRRRRRSVGGVDAASPQRRPACDRSATSSTSATT